MDPELMNEIKLKAYEIYRQNGCSEGSDLEHWLEAERMTLEERAKKSEEKDNRADQTKLESCDCVI
jgi:hypothetical protein